MTTPIHPASSQGGPSPLSSVAAHGGEKGQHHSNVRPISPLDLRVEQLRFEVSPSFGFRDFVILVSGGLSAVAMGLLIMWWTS